MKKFFRNLFSGYFFILLALLIEILVIIFLQLFLDNIFEAIGADNAWLILVYLLIKLNTFIVAFIIFFKIINKWEDPEFKIPWIVGMLVLPLFTSFLFIVFGNHGLRRKDRKIIEATKKVNTAYYSLTEEQAKELKTNMRSSYGTFNYITNTTNLGVHTNNRVTYYARGEEFFPAMLEGLKQAKEFIFMEFFIISDGKEWNNVTEILKEKAQQGVDVRIIYDDMGCGGTISSRTPKILAKYGIKCYKFHPFRPILSGAYNNRDHRKIVIVDHQMAFTGGINLADEYANEIKRFGYWKDTMIKIEGSAISNLISVFFQNHDLCTNKVSDYEKYINYDYEQYDDNGYVMPFGDGPGGIDDALIGEQTYINMLNYAKDRVFISTPYLIPTYSLIDAMRNAAKRGVEVNLILPGIPDKKMVYSISKSHFRYLLDSGVNIYLYTPGFNHMKAMSVDCKMAFVGTINFDFRSLVHHFECGALLVRSKCIKDIEDDFIDMLKVCTKVPQDFKLPLRTRSFCSIAKLFTTLM